MTPFRSRTDRLAEELNDHLAEAEQLARQMSQLDGLAERKRAVDEQIAHVRRELDAAGRKLDRVSVASPCNADWASMVGDERTRFCGSCQKNVYNLSGMTQGEAEDFVRTATGEVCIRFFRRADGTVLTDDCPEGVSRKRRRRLVMVGASVATLAGGAAYAMSPSERHMGGMAVDMGSQERVDAPQRAHPAIMGTSAPMVSAAPPQGPAKLAGGLGSAAPPNAR